MNEPARDPSTKVERKSLASELTGLTEAMSGKAVMLNTQANQLEECLRGTSTPYDAVEEKEKEPAGLLPTVIRVSRTTANTLIRVSKILESLIKDVQPDTADRVHP